MTVPVSAPREERGDSTHPGSQGNPEEDEKQGGHPGAQVTKLNTTGLPLSSSVYWKGRGAEGWKSPPIGLGKGAENSFHWCKGRSEAGVTGHPS